MDSPQAYSGVIWTVDAQPIYTKGLNHRSLRSGLANKKMWSIAGWFPAILHNQETAALAHHCKSEQTQQFSAAAFDREESAINEQ